MSSSSNKLDYLSNKYLDDPKKKKKKQKKQKKKESRRRGHNHSDDDHDALGFNLPADRQNNDYESDVENDELDEGPVVVDAHELGDAAAAATASSMELRVPPTATPYGNNNSTSQLDRGQRHDSSESEQSAQQEARSHQKRYDSSPSVEHEGRAATRQRHDSSDDDDKNISSKSNTRRRHDSSDDDDDDDDDADNQSMVNRPASHRKRHDSSASDSSREPSRRRSKSRRHDSEDDDDDDKDSCTDARHTKRKTRHDSDDDDDDSSRHSDSNKTRLSSGHKAGLQTSTDFAKQQAKTTRRNKQLAQATVDQHGMGETIHRDEYGRKQSAMSVAEAQEQARRLALQKQQQELELNMGTKQKEAVMRQQEEMSKLANAGFARHADDDELETLRKGAIREGDPMAAQAAKQSRKRSATSRADSGGASAKRLYTGPPPKPNRFGIRPGFRWDGHDRGNGFEDKLLARQYMKQHQAEQAHMWSTRDM